MPAGVHLSSLVRYHRCHHNCGAMAEATITVALSQRQDYSAIMEASCNHSTITEAGVTAVLSQRPPNCYTFMVAAKAVALSWRLPQL